MISTILFQRSIHQMTPRERGLLRLSMIVQIEANKECGTQFNQGEHSTIGFEVGSAKVLFESPEDRG